MSVVPTLHSDTRGLKHRERKAHDWLPPYGLEVKNDWCFASTSHGVVLKHRKIYAHFLLLCLKMGMRFVTSVRLCFPMNCMNAMKLGHIQLAHLCPSCAYQHVRHAHLWATSYKSTTKCVHWSRRMATKLRLCLSLYFRKVETNIMENECRIEGDMSETLEQ
jgi:hypothetical protein